MKTAIKVFARFLTNDKDYKYIGFLIFRVYSGPLCISIGQACPSKKNQRFLYFQ
jgi:hypothetical protein